MSAAPKIAFYSDAAAVGGAEMFLGTLLDGLTHELEVVIVGVSPEVTGWLAARREGSEVVSVPSVRGRRDLRSFLVNLRAIRLLGANIFQANLPVPASSQYALAAATLTPELRTIAVEHLPYPLTGELQRRLKRFSSRRLAAHVAVGARVARQVEALAGLPGGSVSTIHNGVADLALPATARAFDGCVLGSIGRLDHQKGFDVLLAAIARLPEARLVIVGDGPDRGRLEALARDLGVSERVRFEGWHDDARRYLTAFDVFVLPSRFEGFPLAIVEAMLAGLPVVATRVGSVCEAVIDGETGILVASEDPDRLADALQTLLEDPGRRHARGVAGRSRSEQFTAAAMVTAYEHLYAQLLP